MSNSNRPKPMNDEFKQYLDELNEKLAVAAKAMKDVNEVCTKARLPGVLYTQYTAACFNADGDYDAIHKMYALINKGALRTEIDNAGWSTSSSIC